MYILSKEETMRTAKVFKSGNSQAVRLPKEFQIDAKEVEIFKENGSLILRPLPKTWKAYLEHGRRFTEDFPDKIADQPAEERGAL
jgi:antitoxin VapB